MSIRSRNSEELRSSAEQVESWIEAARRIPAIRPHKVSAARAAVDQGLYENDVVIDAAIEGICDELASALDVETDR